MWKFPNTFELDFTIKGYILVNSFSVQILKYTCKSTHTYTHLYTHTHIWHTHTTVRTALRHYLVNKDREE